MFISLSVKRIRCMNLANPPSEMRADLLPPFFSNIRYFIINVNIGQWGTGGWLSQTLGGLIVG